MTRGTGGTALTITQLVRIRHPSNPAWSPDGSRLAFVWDEGGVQNLYVVPVSLAPRPQPLAGRPGTTREGGTPLQVTDSRGLLGNFLWSADGTRLLYEQNGDVWSAAADHMAPEAVIRSEPAESGIALSPDGKRLAFARSGDIWVRDLASGDEQQLTRTPEIETGPVWSPDGRLVAFTTSSAQRIEEAPAYSGAKIVFTRYERTPPDLGVVSRAGGTIVRIGGSADSENAPRWLPDSQSIVLQRVSADLKSRDILVASARDGATRSLHRDLDEKWWSLTYLNPEPVPSPDGRMVAFLTDRDGWDHLYVVDTAGGDAARRLTHGAFEVSRFAWSPDGTRIAYDANPERPGDRQVFVVDLASGQTRQVTRLPGTNTAPVWAPDGRRVAFIHTDPHQSADVYVNGVSGSDHPRRLTTSFPADLDTSRLVAPQFVHYPSKDGKPVPAYLFVPRDLARTRRHPAIVWVHGDGITQNYVGWHVRRDYAVYYSLHQLFVQRGYIVLAVDYRGSIGYGKAWRQGHYRDLGGRDYEDIAAGMAYLRTLGYVDTTRVGVWGLSYGGFMALQAVTVTPDLFRCAIDVAGVVDWADWAVDPDGPWILARMGRPEENRELYERAAPVRRVDRIVRPLMVLHGTADVNVPFAESVRLMDALTKAGKPVEFMIYPGEFHYFHRAQVLRDAWRRVVEFFDRNLR